MAKPMAIYLEDTNPVAPERRYLRCVALVGRQPGLRIDAQGEVTWQRNKIEPCEGEVWVSADDKLILYRPEGAAAVTVERAGRRLELPFEKPVVLVDKDLVTIGGKTLRVHIHGTAKAAVEPSPLPQRNLGKAAGVAAAVALSAALAGCGPTIEVRDDPPEVAADPLDDPEPDGGQPEPEPAVDPEPEPVPVEPAPEPIEVREDPPDVAEDIE